MPKQRWSRRLVARTQDFHSCNTGSIPVGTTDIIEITFNDSTCMKPRIFFKFTLYALGLLVAGAALSGVYFSAYYRADRAHDSAVEQILTEHQNDITWARYQLAALLETDRTVTDRLEAESAKRLAVEQEAKDAQGKINLLSQTVEKNTLPKISDIITQWRPRIAAVHCEWPVKNDVRTTKSGTGVLLSDSTRLSPSVITSKHLLQNAGVPPEQCSLDFPDQPGDIDIPVSDIILSKSKYDWARIEITNPPLYASIFAKTATKRCTEKPAIGDGVVILGYPKIGTKADITATEGIISGTDGNYYITSAKVERGNSGGAAILVKDNCYLGIPTFVDAGEIESLARILKHEQIDD